MNNADLDAETILSVPLIFKEFQLVYNYKVSVCLIRIMKRGVC